MRRGDTSRSRDRDDDTMLVTVSDKSVHEKSLSTPCSSGKKYIVPHREYVECFVLDHDEECSQKEGKNNKKILYLLWNKSFAKNFFLIIISSLLFLSMLSSAKISSPLGDLIAVADEHSLHLLEFADHSELSKRLAMIEKRLSFVIPTVGGICSENEQMSHAST